MDGLNYTAVAALDLGTKNSGYAFSLKSSPLNIRVNECWDDGSRHSVSFKTPTCVLLDKNKEFKAFGFDAENEFADICLDEEKDDYYFFRGFYMQKVLPLIETFNH